MKHTYTVYLKGGHKLKLRGDDLEISWSQETGHCLRWLLKGAARYRKPLFIDPTEIVAVIL